MAPTTRDEQRIARWQADIDEIRADIAAGRVEEPLIYTLEHIAAERQRRIDRLKSLI